MRFISWRVGWLAEAVFNLATRRAWSRGTLQNCAGLQNQAAQQGKNGGPMGGHGAGTTAGHHRPEFHYSGWRRLLI